MMGDKCELCAGSGKRHSIFDSCSCEPSCVGLGECAACGGSGITAAALRAKLAEAEAERDRQADRARCAEESAALAMGANARLTRKIQPGDADKAVSMLTLAERLMESDAALTAALARAEKAEAEIANLRAKTVSEAVYSDVNERWKKALARAEGWETLQRHSEKLLRRWASGEDWKPTLQAQTGPGHNAMYRITEDGKLQAVIAGLGLTAEQVAAQTGWEMYPNHDAGHAAWRLRRAARARWFA